MRNFCSIQQVLGAVMLLQLLWNVSLRRTPTVASSFVHEALPGILRQQRRTTIAKRFVSSPQQRSSSSSSSSKNNNSNKKNIQVPQWIPDALNINEEDNGGYSRPVIQWYPGHIAKAERLLQETFQAVDVVVEVRDARASKATSHPKVPEWCGNGRPRLVVFTHGDMVPSSTTREWRQYHEQQEGINNDSSEEEWAENDNNPNNSAVQYLWVNAKQGQGIPALHRAIFKAGSYVQERRQRRGLKDRPLRVGLMGYPNVGKSALINRLLGRRRARTANTPGVTRSLQWIRVRTDDTKKTNKKEYELLDSPGIIPASLEDQSDALLLAACHCIGEASYDNQVVASYLCQWMQNLLITGQADQAAPQWQDQCRQRWGVHCLKPVPVKNPYNMPHLQSEEDGSLRYITGEEILHLVADNTCQGNLEDASRKILQDFRTGRMGPVCLQLAPHLEDTDEDSNHDNNAFANIPDPRMGTIRTGEAVDSLNNWELIQQQQEQERQERILKAREAAKERGLELPPKLEQTNTSNSSDTSGKKIDNETPDDVGKGLFDGW